MSRHDKTFFDDRITQLSLLMHFAQAQFLEPQFLILKIRKNGKIDMKLIKYQLWWYTQFLLIKNGFIKND